MNIDEFIRMAQECQLIGTHPHLDGIYQQSLARFAALVAAAEREACAKVCDGLEISNDIEGLHPEFGDGMLLATMQCSAAIRARGNE
jgi:hypothetical protein